MGTLGIGKVAAATGLTVEAIRFYEKRGLLNPPPRSASGYRQYPEDVVRRLRFIQHAKDAGFTLTEIGDLLRLKKDAAGSCSLIKQRAEIKLKDIELKLKDLEIVRGALSKLVTKCEEAGEMGECPIIETLELENEN